MTASVAALADACNPALPGCRPEVHTGVGVAFLLLLALVVVVLVVVGLVIIFAVRRSHRRRAQQVQGFSGPGWLRDPTGRFPWRWWDGYRWTDSVSDGTTVSSSPLQ